MKFKIKDEDGRKYEIEEVEETETKDDMTESCKEEVIEDENTLTPDEISALKGLAAVAPKLLELLKVEEKEHEENPELVDEDIDEDEEDDEEILETKTYDSKKSIGSLETKKVSRCDDSLTDDVCTAWSKRYGGKM